ncbi:hypothetical protein [Paraburkholderia sp. BCC1886]|uniref:hypothetical protein n=1 Tax=Paraburkholderia sp. BCC1886 TaxID=2562670 RepID=UPI001642AD96|nr:hypothetical protein [Paraburkholderia sp. BCC1886]
MNALTVFLCIWAMVAVCAILFIRGATLRDEQPGQTPFAARARSTRRWMALRPGVGK